MDDARMPHLKRYAAVLPGATLLLYLLRMAVLAVFAFEFPLGAAAILPTILAAMLVGQARARRTGALPFKARAWRFALAAGAVHVAVRVFLAVSGPALFAAVGGVTPGGNRMDTSSFPFVSALALGLGLVSVPPSGWFVVAGARSALGPR